MVTDEELLAALIQEDDAIKLKSQSTSRSANLKDLHVWFRELVDSKPTALSLDQLCKLMEYKLAREKWRPRLQVLVASNPEAKIKSITSSVTPILKDDMTTDDILNAISHLASDLKGVGPATASLILSAYRPKTIPFFSDEAHQVLGLGKPDYTKKSYATFCKAMKARAKSSCWNNDVSRLEKACFCHVILSKSSTGNADVKAKTASTSHKQPTAQKEKGQSSRTRKKT